MSANVEILMGHSLGKSSPHLKPTKKELLAGYLKAVPQLTVQEADDLEGSFPGRTRTSGSWAASWRRSASA